MNVYFPPILGKRVEDREDKSMRLLNLMASASHSFIRSFPGYFAKVETSNAVISHQEDHHEEVSA